MTSQHDPITYSAITGAQMGKREGQGCAYGHRACDLQRALQARSPVSSPPHRKLSFSPPLGSARLHVLDQPNDNKNGYCEPGVSAMLLGESLGTHPVPASSWTCSKPMFGESPESRLLAVPVTCFLVVPKVFEGLACGFSLIEDQPDNLPLCLQGI